ncbi:MAG: heavy-metal-associated domain-containing protein [bacterium]|nr:heavy-metal-associated domain-containing protein [bacterium]
MSEFNIIQNDLRINEMKKIIFVISLFITIKTTQAQILTAELVANGLTCSMCSFATQRQLETIPFIDSIGSDLNHTTFILFFKKDSILDFNLIKKKVEDAGFSVGSLVLSFAFYNLQIDNNFHLQYQNTLFHFMDVRKQTLNGEVKIKIIDKGFLTTKEFKKYKKIAVKYPCYETGKMEGVNKLHHITVLQ